MPTFKTFNDHKVAEAFLLEQLKKHEVETVLGLIEKLVDKSKTFDAMTKRGYGEQNPEFKTEVDELQGLVLSILEAHKTAKIFVVNN